MTRDEEAILKIARQMGERIHNATVQKALVEEYLETQVTYSRDQWLMITRYMGQYEDAIRLSPAEAAMLMALYEGESVLAAKLSTR